MKVFLWLILMVFTPLLAFAEATTPALSSGEVVANFLSTVIFPVIATLATAIVGIVLNKIRQKYNIDISYATQDYLELLARQGVAKAEELAAQAAKNNIDNFTSREKLNVAINHIIASAPKVTEERAASIVHAVLAKIPGVGATGEEVVNDLR